MKTLTQDQLDYHKDFIFKSRENKLQFFEALPNRFYSKDAIKLGLNFHMQSRTVGALLSSCMPYLLKQPRFGMYEKVKVITENLEIMKENRKLLYWTKEEMNTINNLIEKGTPHNDIVRQLHAKFNYRTLHSINLKVSRMKHPNAEITNPFFYTKDTIAAMQEALQTTETISSIAQRFADSLDKSYPAVLAKMNQLSKRMPNRKKTRFSKSKPSSIVKKELNFEPIVEQQPAEIGIEVPHGMTFEGKPKKIMLHSDHFRIYF